MSKKNNSITGIIMLFAAAIIWGSTFVAQSIGTGNVDAFTFNGIRNIIAVIFLIPCIKIIDLVNKNDKRNLKEIYNKKLIYAGLVCGVLLFAASALQQIGIKYTTVGKSGFITSLYIVLVPVIGVFTGKKIEIKTAVCIILATIGLYLLCVTEGFSITKGDSIVFLCAIVFSLHIIAIDKFAGIVDGVRLALMQFLVSGIISLILMFIFEKPDIAGIQGAMAPILYAGILSSGIAYTFQIIAQKNVEPHLASMIMSLESVFAALSGFIILHEKMTLKELSGCVLVFGAVILAQIKIPGKSS